MGITIVDIARYAGVSKSTVSRVLNADPHVSDSSRQKVRAAMEALDFKPNAAARTLVLKRSNSFSLIVQDIRNPYYAHASWIAERYFHQHGYDLVIHNADNDLKMEREILDSIQYRGVDGVLSVGGNQNVTHVLDFHMRVKLPLVLVDREVTGYDIPAVNLDNRLGGKLATEFLLDRGHRLIAFATSDFTGQEVQRREGYEEALRQSGVETPDDYVISQSEELWSEGKCPQLSELIERGNAPTAIFASNDVKALQLMRVATEHGMRIPNDISIIGYDDIPIASIVIPSLSTVHQPFDHMVETGARLLLESSQGKNVEAAQQLFEPWLIERESTAKRNKTDRNDRRTEGRGTSGPRVVNRNIREE